MYQHFDDSLIPNIFIVLKLVDSYNIHNLLKSHPSLQLCLVIMFLTDFLERMSQQISRNKFTQNHFKEEFTVTHIL